MDTFTLDGVQYKSESIPQEALGLFNDIERISQEQQDLNVKLGITKIAKDTLLQKFIEFKDSFEAIEQPEKEDETLEKTE